MKDLKKDALDIINGAIKSVLPEEAVKEALKRELQSVKLLGEWLKLQVKFSAKTQ